jgi:hypothetical protein
LAAALLTGSFFPSTIARVNYPRYWSAYYPEMLVGGLPVCDIFINLWHHTRVASVKLNKVIQEVYHAYNRHQQPAFILHIEVIMRGSEVAR